MENMEYLAENIEKLQSENFVLLAKNKTLTKKLELAERMAEFIKNKRFFLRYPYLLDANILLDAWYEKNTHKASKS